MKAVKIANLEVREWKDDSREAGVQARRLLMLHDEDCHARRPHVRLSRRAADGMAQVVM